MLYKDDFSRLMQEMFMQWQAIGAQAIAEKGRFDVALSGGRTPGALYRYLAARIDLSLWSKTGLFLADERVIEENHEQSNYKFVKENLLDCIVSGTKPRLHQVVHQGGSAAEVAADYQKDLEGYFQEKRQGFPIFDLIILGIGEDGHTASLFLGDAALDEQKKWVVPVECPEGLARVTLTLPVLNAARHIFFLALGEQKAAIIAKMWDGANLPAARVKPTHGQVSLFVDNAAGALILKKG